MIQLDLHVHTKHSRDGFCSAAEAVEAAKRKGLSGIAITDHNTVSGCREAMRFSEEGFLIIPGIEISCRLGHVLGLGVSEEIPRGLSPEETVERVREQGGVAIAAHPFAPLRNPAILWNADFDAVEILNARAAFPSNLLARKYVEEGKLVGVGGSDAHRSDEVGLAYTKMECDPELGAVLKKIKKGEVAVDGRTLPLPILLWRALQRVSLRR